MGLVQNILCSQLGKANPRRIEIGKELGKSTQIESNK